MTLNQTIANSYQVKYETHTIGGHDYRIRSLLDRQQYYDPDGLAEKAGIAPAMWPIFGLVWPAGLFLANTMSSFPFHGKRILEIGCGIALSSLVLQRRGADISSTDIHPVAESFLAENLKLNKLGTLPFHSGSWEDSLLPDGKYDLIIGSDLLYESEHPSLLASFIDRHANDDAEVIVVDPGRGHRGKFTKLMADLQFETQSKWAKTQPVKEYLPKGSILHFERLNETHAC